MENREESSDKNSALYQLAENNVCIKYKLNTAYKWSNCETLFPQIFVRGRCWLMAEPNCEYRKFIGFFSKSEYSETYQATIAWWTGLYSGFSEKSIIEFYQKTVPSLKDHLLRLFKITKGSKRKYDSDHYGLYLLSKVDEKGKIEYNFEIVNETTQVICDSGVIYPGYISTRLNSGKRERILKAI